MADSGFFADIFEDEIRSIGTAILALSGFFYIYERSDQIKPFRRENVHYAVEAYLPQVYDRSIIAARATQRLTKTLIIKALRIDILKSELQRATVREKKLSGLSELFTLSLAGIISAAHVHSLSITFHVLKNLTLALVFVLRKHEEAQRDSSGGMAVVSKLRSWWSDGLQGLIVKSFVENLKQHMEGLPFASVVDENSAETTDKGDCFSVEALLQFAVPVVVSKALGVVRDAKNRYPPNVFDVTSLIKVKVIRQLFCELCAEFESCVFWPDWLTPPPSLQPATTTTTEEEKQQSSQSSPQLLGGGCCHSEESRSLLLGPDCVSNVFNTCAGPSQRLSDGCLLRKTDVYGAAAGSVSDRANGGGRGRSAACEETLRCEVLARNQAARFFAELISSAAFNELCIAHAAEVLERTAAAVGDVSSASSYDASSDSARVAHVITLLEAHRIRLLDEEFEVPYYLRLFCAETVRGTCGRNLGG